MLLSLVFMTTFLRGQNVDPETFPALNSGIGIKYLYTNTGGEGKILVDSIATRVRSYWTNGVNGQDSLGLGGQLVQSTNIYTNNFPMTFLNSPFDGFGRFYFGTNIYNGSFNTFDNKVSISGTGLDTTIGSELLAVDSRIVNLASSDIVGLQSSFNATNGYLSDWKFIENSSAIKARFKPNSGFLIEPRDIELGLTFLGNDIFTVLNTTGGSIFKVKTNNIINEVLPSYADDADAGANGLVLGDRYQTSGAGSAPLNVAGIVMIKQ